MGKSSSFVALLNYFSTLQFHSTKNESVNR